MIMERAIKQVEARIVTADNLYELSKWCNGSVKGIRLPPEEQVIEMWSFDNEDRAEVGWVIIKEGNMFYSMRQEQFFRLFKAPTPVE